MDHRKRRSIKKKINQLGVLSISFQEKYDEYKQRREAKKFFNQNNDYHLDVLDYFKLLLVGTSVGTILSVFFNVLMVQLSVSLSIFYLFTGYGVGYAVLKVAKYGSNKTGIICIICYLLSIWLGESLFLALTMMYFQGHVSLLYYLYIGLNGLLHCHVFTYLFIFAGAFIAYSIGKD